MAGITFRHTDVSTLLVALDGSATAEQVLPFVRQPAGQFNAAILRSYLEAIVVGLGAEHIRSRGIVDGPAPALAILAAAESEQAALIIMVSHGEAGVARQQSSIKCSSKRHARCLVSAQPSDDT